MANSQGFPIQYRTRSVFGGREGNLWIGRSGGGLCRFRDGTFSCYSRLDGLPSELIRVIETRDRRPGLKVGLSRRARVSPNESSCASAASSPGVVSGGSDAARTGRWDALPYVARWFKVREQAQ